MVMNLKTTTTTVEMTPELVAKVADKVYALLKQDLKIERERYRALAQGAYHVQHAHRKRQ
jgi:DNA polymerase IIIc chi subunit